MTKARGYAVVMDDKIDMRTVSATRRAAIVNWLVANAVCMVYLWTTDDEIEVLWARYNTANRAHVTEVTIYTEEPR